MPFTSKAQQRFLCATNEKLCKDFGSKTPKSAYKNLPEYVSDKKGKKKK
tara:strand:+ start:1845 stop:1991 length:147 start_codon:yes stop_codon:yes gene_type:complete